MKQHPIERNAINAAAILNEIAARVPAVLANIDDNLPGYPQAAAAGSGSSAASRDIHSPVLAAILAAEAGTTEPALDAWHELQELDRKLTPILRRYLDLTSRWGYTTGATQAHHAKLARTTGDDWCTSCLRVHRCSPRERGDLCRWCDDFKRAEGTLPPAELLEARHRGMKITQTMVRQAKVARKGRR